ncbi:hypothetical protein KAR91_09090 [Candidatus Pacearchaeota archaeon]|nr:hypothetical protein [Candidatus Pacearchaeota archaeon]
MNDDKLFWWAFNSLWIIVVAMGAAYLKGIRDELRGMRNDLKTEQRYNKWLINVVNMIRTRCQMMHPDTPMPHFPDPPEEVDDA